MSEEPNAEEIVLLLRSEDGEDRKTALRALYGKDGVLLMQLRPMTMLHSWTELDGLKLFTCLLVLAQKVGKSFGMNLQWVKQPEGQKILTPQGGAFR